MTEPENFDKSNSRKSDPATATGPELVEFVAEVRREVRQLWTVEARDEREARDVLLGETDPPGDVRAVTQPGETGSETLTVEILEPGPVAGEDC